MSSHDSASRGGERAAELPRGWRVFSRALVRSAVGAALCLQAACGDDSLSSRGSAPTPRNPVSVPATDPAELVLEQTAPAEVSVDAQFNVVLRVRNLGDEAAANVTLVDTLPGAGSFVWSQPSAVPDGASPNRLTLALGELGAGGEKEVVIRWRAPLAETTLFNQATVMADGGLLAEGTVVIAVHGAPSVSLAQATPPGVFASQEFDIVLQVQNGGPGTATRAVLSDTLPSAGELVSSVPPGSLSGNVLTFDLGDLPPADPRAVTIRWRAPASTGTLLNYAAVTADGGVFVESTASIDVGAISSGQGDVAVAGTALRNRKGGSLEITGIPAEAVITRAVLTWAILYSTPTPPAGTLKLDGVSVTADLTAATSGNLCWGDTATIGYAADVTAVAAAKGNGTYRVDSVVNGITGDDLDSDGGLLPYTDGATLLVYFSAPGITNQVKSDFSYHTNTVDIVTRAFDGIDATGAPARLILSGPDGQTNGSDTTEIVGATQTTLNDLWDGSDAIDGNPFSIGDLWDTEVLDVTALLPAGQTTLTARLLMGGDCVGISAAVLVVGQ